MTVVLRDSTQTIANYHFNTVGILTGPYQVNDASWTPSLWVAPAQNHGNTGIELTLDRTTWNRRGIGWGGGDSGAGGTGGVAGFVSNWSYRQGGITPFFACMNCTTILHLLPSTMPHRTLKGQALSRLGFHLLSESRSLRTTYHCSSSHRRERRRLSSAERVPAFAGCGRLIFQLRQILSK